MQSTAKDPEEYLQSLSPDRRKAVSRLREVIKNNLPAGFEEGMGYGMLSFHVPHSMFPSGYHSDPTLPLPFINLASQKNYIALYHMGLYANNELLDWFVSEFPQYSKRKLDMGKSCIRFKNPDDIPYDLIGELASKMTAEEWIKLYESKIKR